MSYAKYRVEILVGATWKLLFLEDISSYGDALRSDIYAKMYDLGATSDDVDGLDLELNRRYPDKDGRVTITPYDTPFGGRWEAHYRNVAVLIGPQYENRMRDRQRRLYLNDQPHSTVDSSIAGRMKAILRRVTGSAP